jgi:hypothetical protein
MNECKYVTVDCCQDIFWLSICDSGLESCGGIVENYWRWHGTWDIVSYLLLTPQLVFHMQGSVYLKA